MCLVLGALTAEVRETLVELGDLLGPYVTCVLHTARISNSRKHHTAISINVVGLKLKA